MWASVHQHAADVGGHAGELETSPIAQLLQTLRDFPLDFHVDVAQVAYGLHLPIVLRILIPATSTTSQEQNFEHPTVSFADSFSRRAPCKKFEQILTLANTYDFVKV